MISDILSDAVADIREYQSSPTYADVYADLKTEIDAVVESMTNLRKKLDAPPKEE